MAKTEKASKVETILEAVPANLAAANDQIRKVSEDAMEQSKEAYGKMKSAVEDSQKVVEATFEKAQAANNDLGMKTISAARKAGEANLAHMEKLMGVKTVAEFFELQTSFLRSQTEWTVAEAKTLSEAATKAATEVSAPAKSAMEDAAKNFKV